MGVSTEKWRVVGGCQKGGIKVRIDKDCSSPLVPARLSTGALICALEHDEGAGRLHYKLLTGTGPTSGWVATAAHGKDLLVKASAEPSEEPIKGSQPCRDGTEATWWQDLAQAAQKSPGCTIRSQGTPAQGGGGAPKRLGDVSIISFRGRPRGGPGSTGTAAERSGNRSRSDAGALSHPGEEEDLCPHCQLPIGEIGYVGDQAAAGAGGVGPRLHGECAAQLMLQDASKQERACQERDAALKRRRRAEYEIGWRADRIPSNVSPASKLGCALGPGGLCCLVLAEESSSRSLRLAPTADPALSVNLEYFSLALQVRRSDGREPLFSLDPKGTAADVDAAAWQVKRFEPPWLAPTSVGEVMFQADIHLKELSMGESLQPVAGMRSCLDLAADEAYEGSWSAREWFVVKKANIGIRPGGVLAPRVEMGVEARELVGGPYGLEDAQITRPDHPLVKYAESFTHFFDLIAERKSAIYHLRELAKATVLAKFSIDSDINLGDQWFDLAGEGHAACCVEIPQMWNRHTVSQIHVEGGKILDAGDAGAVRTRGVYGGVQFGLDQFQLGAVPAGPVVSGVAVPTAQRSFARQAPTKGIIPFRKPDEPRGVDLNLDAFDLPATIQVAEHEEPPACSWGRGLRSAGDIAAFSQTFWRSLEQEGELLPEDDRTLLREVFHPQLSDRREEGDRFVPPDPSQEYLEKLRGLVREEGAVRDSWKRHFLSGCDLDAGSTGHLLPGAWTPAVGVAQGGAPRGGRLHPRPDYDAEAPRFERALRSAVPTFDRRTGDGVRFRAYEVGGLQVRTTQERGGKEIIGGFFSSRPLPATPAAEAGPSAVEGEQVLRATQHVERTAAQRFHYYVVLETGAGNAVVAEQCGDQVRWATNPQDLEARGALARVTRRVDCHGTVLAVGAMQEAQGRDEIGHASSEGSKLYADRLCAAAASACEGGWAAFSPPQREAAQRLGIHQAHEWFEASAEVFQLEWAKLADDQRLAARDLGLDEASWNEMASWTVVPSPNTRRSRP